MEDAPEALRLLIKYKEPLNQIQLKVGPSSQEPTKSRVLIAKAKRNQVRGISITQESKPQERTRSSRIISEKKLPRKASTKN